MLRLIDEQYLKTPFYGSRRMIVHLRQQGFEVNRKRVQRLMHQLGLQAIYPKPKLSQAHPEHKVYPYLLRGVDIVAVNQVWSTDITYLPVLKGHFYLVAIMDWFSRKVLSWQVSNTMDVQFCSRCPGGGVIALCQTHHLQLRSRRSVYRSGVYRAASSGQYLNQHGWPWTLS